MQVLYLLVVLQFVRTCCIVVQGTNTCFVREQWEDNSAEVYGLVLSSLDRERTALDFASTLFAWIGRKESWLLCVYTYSTTSLYQYA
jgi:hypothetical protein